MLSDCISKQNKNFDPVIPTSWVIKEQLMNELVHQFGDYPLVGDSFGFCQIYQA
jgi:hypothetical protein